VLRIDRVRAEVDVLPESEAVGPAGAPETASVAEGGRADDREWIRDIVLEVLRDQLRQLERRGLL
jgi:hypothetical protein